MAQLIKLQNYISRYEKHLTHYTNQFLRLKQQRWQERQDEAAQSGYDNKQMQQVREQFLHDVFHFQLRWASATLKFESLFDAKYEKDQTLMFLLKQLPDNYLLFYEPLFQIENALVDLGIVVVAPTNIYCLFFLEGEKNDIYQAEKGRFWWRLRGNTQRKMISPLLSLRRTTSIIKQLFTSVSFSMPVKEVILAPDGYVDYFQPHSTETECIDVRSFHDWHERMLNNPSPMKHLQLKTVQLFLQHCETEAYERYYDHVRQTEAGPD